MCEVAIFKNTTQLMDPNLFITTYVRPPSSPLDSLRLFDVTILLNFVCNFLLHAYRLQVHCVRSGSTADQITMACYCLPLNNFGNVLKFFFVDMNHPV